MAGKERHREGQHEYAGYADPPSAVKEIIDDQVADAGPPAARINRDGAQFGEIFPQNMQCAASDNGVIGGTARDAELEHILVKVHRRLVQQPSRSHVLVDQGSYYRDIPSARWPDYVTHGGHHCSAREYPARG